jgi:hypothetical protein
MNPIANFREVGADIPSEKAKQPQDQQDYYDSPHDISPFERLVGCHLVSIPRQLLRTWRSGRKMMPVTAMARIAMITDRAEKLMLRDGTSPDRMSTMLRESISTRLLDFMTGSPFFRNRMRVLGPTTFITCKKGCRSIDLSQAQLRLAFLRGQELRTYGPTLQ